MSQEGTPPTTPRICWILTCNRSTLLQSMNMRRVIWIPPYVQFFEKSTPQGEFEISIQDFYMGNGLDPCACNSHNYGCPITIPARGHGPKDQQITKNVAYAISMGGFWWWQEHMLSWRECIRMVQAHARGPAYDPMISRLLRISTMKGRAPTAWIKYLSVITKEHIPSL